LVVFDVPWFIWAACRKLGYHDFRVDRLNPAAGDLRCCAAWAFLRRQPFFHLGGEFSVVRDTAFRVELTFDAGRYATIDIPLDKLLMRPLCGPARVKVVVASFMRPAAA
jgi:hypothetical protein